MDKPLVVSDDDITGTPTFVRALEVVCRGRKISAYCDGRLVAEALDDRLGRGGAGYLAESGLAGFRDTRIS